MKGMCYIALIIAFLMFYQREPIFTVVIIGLAIGLYLFFKSRKSSSRGGGRGFLSALTGRANNQQERNIDNMITLMMVQQLFSDNSSKNLSSNTKQFEKKENSHQKEMKRIKEEVLSLFNED